MEKQWRREETSEESSEEEDVTENLELSASSGSDLSLSPEKPGIKAAPVSKAILDKKGGRRTMLGRLGSRFGNKSKRASTTSAAGAESDDDF